MPAAAGNRRVIFGKRMISEGNHSACLYFVLPYFSGNGHPFSSKAGEAKESAGGVACRCEGGMEKYYGIRAKY